MIKFKDENQLVGNETKIVVFDYYGRQKTYQFVMYDKLNYGYFKEELSREIERFYIPTMIRDWDCWIVEGEYKDYSKEVIKHQIERIKHYAETEIDFYSSLLTDNFE